MDELQSFLEKPLFTFFEHTFTLGQLILVPSVIVLGLIIARWVVSIISKRMLAKGVSPDAIHLVQRIFYIIVIIVIIITVLDFINVPITAFAFLSGAIAIGFGFGAQNIINNFISGWILMWEKPIRIGDQLEVDNAKGVVETINTRSTRIRRSDGVHMLIPNSKLLENTVVNWTLVDKMTRTSVRIGVAYGSNCKQVAELIFQATSEQTEVLTDPKPSVIFDDFGDNALMFEVYFWMLATADRDLRKIRSDIRFRIDELFAEHNIVIAFPQRDVHIDGQLNVVTQSQNSSDN